jgi:DNA-directed RNA polymerase subunit RPC12/RpoP
MSEFKYACPVCGQHVVCDSSQAGSTIECPTCFQKITVPQAPASGDPKFIITGTKKGERPPPKILEANPYAVPKAKGSPGTLVVVIILIFVGAVVAYVYHGAKFSIPFLGPTYGRATDETNQSFAKWTLNLEGVTIPDSPAAGRIHGQDFLAERANFSTNGILTIRSGTRGAVEFGVAINFSDAAVESLAGQTLNVATNAEKAARVTLRWKNGGQTGRESFDDGYAMRLKFSALANNRLPGEIYLCTPDEMNSYVAGTFNVEVRKPKRQN